MQGLAGSLTPAGSGNVCIIISGTIIPQASHGIEYQISYGTGAPPGSNASLVGTQIGAIQEYESSLLTGAIPFSLAAVVTGLTLSTTYWIDLAAKAIGAATTVELQNVSITAFEF